MTPRWEIVEVVYEFEEDGDTLSLIMGKFDGHPALGMHWGKYNRNAPLVLGKNAAAILITGLLQQAISKGNQAEIEKFMGVIQDLNSINE